MADALIDYLAKAEIQNKDSMDFPAIFLVRHSTPVDLPSVMEIQNSGSKALLGRLAVRGENSQDLLSTFFVKYFSVDYPATFILPSPRRLGGNWQRKMWSTGSYCWRARYDSVADEIKIEYIAKAGIEGNTWVENANAAIDCSGFAAGWIEADFTVRGPRSGIPTTIHYSDGVDSWVAESDESSEEGWSWENITKVFDGTAPDYYRKVNLSADRKTPIPKLWVSAIFYDQSEGKQWVVGRQQSTGGDITGWEAAVDISDVDNTNTLRGESSRSMGISGVLKDDLLFVYKEGDGLKSRYWTGGAFEAIQTIDAAAYSGKAMFDFEHGIEAGSHTAALVYIDADGSTQFTHRLAGAAETWDAPTQIQATVTRPGCVAIIHWDQWYIVFQRFSRATLHYRIHILSDHSWTPPLACPAISYDVSTTGIITTLSFEQGQAPDDVEAGQPVAICWVGETPLTRLAGAY